MNIEKCVNDSNFLHIETFEGTKAFAILSRNFNVKLILKLVLFHIRISYT